VLSRTGAARQPLWRKTRAEAVAAGRDRKTLPRRFAACPRGGGHRERALPSGQGGANGATVCERHPYRPCHKRAIHSGPERSPADN
jgi:hypothetical protein